MITGAGGVGMKQKITHAGENPGIWGRLVNMWAYSTQTGTTLSLKMACQSYGGFLMVKLKPYSPSKVSSDTHILINAQWQLIMYSPLE